ncbi:MAG: HEAT repeat domain-containing protein [Myxococcota bacterium]
MIESASEFKRLRESESPNDYRRTVVESAPEEVWLELLLEPEWRFWVACNRTVPDKVLELLAKDGDSRVRGQVARTRRTPPGILAMLAKDADEGVRLAVAVNARTPRDILESLQDDAWESIREAVNERLR